VDSLKDSLQILWASPRTAYLENKRSSKESERWCLSSLRSSSHDLSASLTEQVEEGNTTGGPQHRSVLTGNIQLLENDLTSEFAIEPEATISIATTHSIPSICVSISPHLGLDILITPFISEIQYMTQRYFSVNLSFSLFAGERYLCLSKLF
jgi:hypothetical protein